MLHGPPACLPAGEGTQIEPAKVFPSGGSSSPNGVPEYQSYGEQPGQDEWLYLNITLEYALRLRQQAQHPERQQGRRPEAGGGDQLHAEL